MTDFCRKTYKRIHCKPEIEHAPPRKPACEPMSVCLPFGRSLKFDGVCLSVEGTPTIEDGEYGVIVVENGCIVDARPNPVCEYTPPPCTPAATECSSTSTSGGDLTLQPDACNLTALDAAGRLGTYLVVEGGDNITVSGCGTTTSPLVISASVDVDASTYVQSKDSTAITVEGSGTVSNPYVIGLTEVMDSGTYGNFRVDSYGRIISYVESSTTSVTAIMAGNGIEVLTTSGIATVTLAESGVDSGDYLLGGYTVSYDLAGRATSIDQTIAVTAGMYDLHDWLVTVNRHGSIEAITAYDRPATNHAVAHIVAGGTITCDITVDVTGYLYAVWRGKESVSSSSVSNNAYTDAVGSYMTGTISTTGGTQSFGSVCGKFSQDVTVSSSGSSVTTSMSLVEWRGKSYNQVSAGTYTVTLSLASDATPSTMSILEVFVVCAS